ncbi:sugar 3,4-ketoisomerase [Niabella beijingensis]|uniref:sugar 3,4-ketoisomerase n=1 Tax=Niabella beijingensis TaxID=2872700 RepID=UPI001CBD4EDB|nr:FdtA/QdtA family cupin domain-containing protein [Niabella beijingensis]MBZ4189993.1 FdtA/QdtA family cupin domain-containing protein [Niabella beijingensis]
MTELPQIIQLPRVVDKRGNLSFLQHCTPIPFEIKRTYWIYDVPGGATRGGHAFREQQEFIIALSGSFDIILDNGEKETRYSLNRSYFGLFVPKLYWRRVENFSTNSLALFVSDRKFNASDYVRDFEEFQQLKSVLR